MSQRAKRKRTVTEDAEAVFSRRKKEPERQNVEKKFTYRVLLPNSSNLTLTLENPDEEMSVGNFIRAVTRKYENGDTDKGSRHIQWTQAYLEDTMGNKIKDGKIIPLAAVNKAATIILQGINRLAPGFMINQDGGIDTVHTYQDMWDVTPEPHLLVALPQDYSTETALADLIDNSLQAVWANASGERCLISVKIGNREISIFDSGQGMDGSKENSIAKWGTMGSSNHRAARCEAVGGKPPYLKPFFGMYGFGGVAASMHLGSVVMVSSKTKTSKKVVTLRLEKDSLVQRSKSDRIWRTPGEIREVSQEERKMSPHGSFTKVHISSLKAQYWNGDQLKCMLKDIYFPYIQNDGSDEAVRTSTPVEFEVNGTNLTEVKGGEVVATNLAACNAPPFILELHFKCHPETDMKVVTAVEEANAKLSCFYFPIIQGKESIDAILENLESEKRGLGENFEKFCRVSIRRLGRLLPDARWGRLPFMEPKRRRTENALIPQQCYKRVKCFVETDAGFSPTTSKTDLAHKHQFTLALKSLGRKPDASSPTIHVDIERDGKPLSLNQLDKEYQEWLRAMHESFDEEVECCDNQAVLILNPSNGRDLGISHNVMRVITQIRRKGQLWKACQRVKIVKGAPGGKDLYATLEYILCGGLEGDPGEARMICRPMECPEERGSKLGINNGIASFELGISKSFPLDWTSSGKCLAVDDETWTKQLEKKRLKAPAFIDILNTEHVQKFDVDKGFPKGETVQAGFDLPKEIIAVVRPHSFTADKSLDVTDQKHIVKDNMEMRMDIRDVRENGFAPEKSAGTDVKYTMQTRTSSRKGVHGLYCFSMEGSRLLEMFTKAGRYRFTFSLVNSSDANPLCREEYLCVEASEKIEHWKLSNQLSDSEGVELKRLEGRLGSEIGPIYISCFDIYYNWIAFKTYPKIQIQVRKMGKPVGIDIENASGNITHDKMHVRVKVLLGGKLNLLRPSFEASLCVGIKEPCYAEMPITVLPGDLSKVEILSKQELDNCLRPEDVIHDFEMQAMDTYGNPVEKGRRVKVELAGLKFQDQSDLYRKVDDQGRLNFGGLLKVIGNYGTKGYIRVSSDSQMLLEKHFQLLSRELKVMSGVPEPEEFYAGSTIDNLVFGIFDEKGQIDEEMNGRQHSLMIDPSPQDGVQYPFRMGICKIPKFTLPAEPGTLEFKAFHSFHPELYVHFKIVPLAMVMLPEKGFDDGAVYQALDESVKSDPCPSDEMTADSKIRSHGISLLNNLKKWDEDLKRRGAKVGQYEAKLSTLQNSLATLEGEIKKLTNGSKGNDKTMSNQGSHRVEQTIEEIKRQGNSAGAAWVELFSSQQLKFCQPPVFSDVIGVVALLGKVESDLISWVVSEYLGKENMLAIVCKSRKGVEQLEMHDSTGKIIPLSGIHGIADTQRRYIDGRFRVICLDDIRCYDGDFKSDDPQKELIIEDPKLLSGSVPTGFIGYAVNLIKLDPENQYSLATPGVGLRETLFFNLLSFVQVYDTRNHMMQAISCIQDGAISLDGGILRQKGVIECGNREEVAVRFPTTSSEEITSPNQCHILIEETLNMKMKQKKKLDDEIKRTKTALDKSTRKVSDKYDEFLELQKEYASLSSLVKPDIFELGSS
ncbi:structural maintenance of chromosomes flexible hinge domain-containing protein GMI1 isoform X1 [Cryptomeria japonica]|uniref:structural maintenance of chromosomes flexible hinge domain-containing protein GMI1 isoform X1 n=2 Tax=Cryptomeria japonica TaxID=3369 RepID=UPI0027DA7CEA|nr:structural maintenance of chromosomes flexible hinge domain-containing protein GMI1 isoform X1 [Cryptomeria japonica]XP_057823649.2 structural maintenance of chromosomes flexible hinge domain-containing protein GMI1 isoform X1 [Cryptomeria japonica]